MLRTNSNYFIDQLKFVFDCNPSLNVKVRRSERPVRLDDDDDVVGAVGEGLDLLAPAGVLAKVGANAQSHDRREYDEQNSRLGQHLVRTLVCLWRVLEFFLF